MAIKNAHSGDPSESKPIPKKDCAVRGMLHGGRAMCGHVIVGLKQCGLPAANGSCEHQRDCK